MTETPQPTPEDVATAATAKRKANETRQRAAVKAQPKRDRVKVRMLVSTIGVKPGQIVTVDAEAAERMIANRQARAV